MSWMPAPGVRVLALPRVIALLAAVALISVASGFGMGWRVHQWRVANAALKAERKIEAAESKERDRQHAIAGRVARNEQAIRDDYEEGKHAIDEHVAAHPELGSCDIGADGLRLWNAWNAGHGVPAAGSVADGAGGRTADGELGPVTRPDGKPP